MKEFDCSKLYYLFKTSHLTEKIDLHYFFQLRIDLNNYVCQYDQLKVSEDLYLLVLKQVYNQRLSSHPWHWKTINLLVCHDFLPKMKDIVYLYVQKFPMFKDANVSKNQYHLLLKLLPIVSLSYTDVIFNLVVKLLLSNWFNIVLIIIDWLTKQWYYIPSTIDKNSTTIKVITDLSFTSIQNFYDLLCQLHQIKESCLFEEYEKIFAEFLALRLTNLRHFIWK